MSLLRWPGRPRAAAGAAGIRHPAPGGFQPYGHTLPDRYPWIFAHARAALARPHPRLLSFGCSRGDEVFSLRRYFPDAEIRGLDVDARSIAICRARARDCGDARISFAVAATTDEEGDAAYDAIFCLAVLCHGDLTTQGARRSTPALRFADFERVVAGFACRLQPGGLLYLHTTNFRFCDTIVSADFDSVLEAEPAQLAPDVLFDRNDDLMPGERYLPVGFRKRHGAADPIKS